MTPDPRAAYFRRAAVDIGVRRAERQAPTPQTVELAFPWLKPAAPGERR